VRARPTAKAVGGCVCLAAMLLLASPGVRVVRAADGEAATVPPGPVCTADAPPAAAAAAARPVQWIERRLPRSDRVVVLNRSGYNYDAAVRPPVAERRVPAASGPR
jgi:type II secretory pathway component HofQ